VIITAGVVVFEDHSIELVGVVDIVDVVLNIIVVVVTSMTLMTSMTTTMTTVIVRMLSEIVEGNDEVGIVELVDVDTKILIELFGGERILIVCQYVPIIMCDDVVIYVLYVSRTVRCNISHNHSGVIHRHYTWEHVIIGSIRLYFNNVLNSGTSRFCKHNIYSILVGVIIFLPRPCVCDNSTVTYTTPSVIHRFVPRVSICVV